MSLLNRSATLLSFGVALTAGIASAQAPAPVPGRPYQFWDVLEADGGARKVYFRNDGTTPITITEVVIHKCDNTRQKCGSFPANMVVAPGKTVVAFKIEQFDKKLGWSFDYTFRTNGGAMVTGPMNASPSQIISMNGGPLTAVQMVLIDSLKPDVAAWTEGASCGSMMVPDLPAGHTLLLMIFGTATNPAARRVMVRLDGNGSAYDYSDWRHDPADPTPGLRQTMITLDLVRQQATVMNNGGGTPSTAFRATGPTLLTAASLGMPGETIAKIVKECGGNH